MSLKKYPELSKFFSTYFSDSEVGQDSQNVQAFLAVANPSEQSQVPVQAKSFLDSATIVEDLGMEANRWFGDAKEAKEWVNSLIVLMNASGNDSVVVKDSNGSVLIEGDPVTVIKDLKVKGGSSDLKRGTLIKKIRLIGDPDNIECNVDGSTLVLKTIFLKKA
jgi:protein PhnA